MPQSILLAVESPTQRPALVLAACEFATTVGAPVVSVLHVVTDERLKAMEEDQPSEFRYVDIILEQVRGDLRTELDDIAGDQGVTLDVQVARGEPGRVILDVAAAGEYDFVVVGVRSRSRVGKLLFGSTPQEVLLGATRPVLAVPLDA